MRFCVVVLNVAFVGRQVPGYKGGGNVFVWVLVVGRKGEKGGTFLVVVVMVELVGRRKGNGELKVGEMGEGSVWVGFWGG